MGGGGINALKKNQINLKEEFFLAVYLSWKHTLSHIHESKTKNAWMKGKEIRSEMSHKQ